MAILKRTIYQALGFRSAEDAMHMNYVQEGNRINSLPIADAACFQSARVVSNEEKEKAENMSNNGGNET